MNLLDSAESVKGMVFKVQNDIPGVELESETLVELLQVRALQQAEQSAYTFLGDGGVTATDWSYSMLDRQSHAIATRLQALHLAGERALLLYPPGLDYLAAFFGCLYAGVIAVPAYPPRNPRNRPRILAIAKDAGVAMALTTSAILPKIQPLLQEGLGIADWQWLATDILNPDLDNSENTIQQSLPQIAPDGIAMLQYTSGSTGTPKGVMLSHRNLMHNAAVTYQVMAHSAASRFISWLPIYHDMGLIGGICNLCMGVSPAR
ncbi:MAG: fatty acyl-AMP ligase [Acaryochloridaceae cyanobacterium RU_4_10]|nr:fatty acyl-AMP ligase [Acaryochloridaceae cyanobacterium RU_4_10]